MSLYRKHRPQTWESVIAQPHVTQTLKQEILSNSQAHAFLFCGPRGVGKTTTARLLAKSLNCTNRKQNECEPCNQCDSCVSITRGNAIDVLEIDAASQSGVDNVRENIIENIASYPTQSTYKIFIIDEVHMLSNSAFNALLKTIEEPPKHVIFIFATTESHKVPATIISRCQQFNFKHIDHIHMQERLAYLCTQEHITIAESVLHHIVWSASGSMRDAESILGQIIVSAENGVVSEASAQNILPPRKTTECISYLTHGVSGDATTALSVLNSILQQESSISHLFDQLIDINRVALLLKTSGSFGQAFFTSNEQEQLSAMIQKTDVTKLLAMLDILIKRRHEIGLSPILQLSLECATLEIALIHQHNARVSELPKTEATRHTSEHQEKNIEHTPPPQKSETKISEPESLSITDIEGKWTAFLEHLHTYNHSLPFIMKTCKPLHITHNILTISLPYEFHRKRIEEPKVQQLIREALKDIYATELSLVALVNEQQANESEKLIAEVLATFGGKVLTE